MTVSFQELLTDCLVALGDDQGLIWSRINKIWPWCIEAMRTFPFGRPQRVDHTIISGELRHFDLPDGFREIIDVEYPVDQDPPVYLKRYNRFDPYFYQSHEFYDVDHNFEDGTGWTLYYSAYLERQSVQLPHMYVDYMADHDLDMEDSLTCYITVPDEYYGILIQQVMCRAYRERLSYYMQDPTTHTSIVMQLTDMVKKAEEQYASQVAAAQQKYSNSKPLPSQSVDKFDRVY